MASGSLAEWLLSVEGVGAEAGLHVQALFAKHDVDRAFLDFLVSDDGARVLGAYRREPPPDSATTPAAANGEQAASLQSPSPAESCITKRRGRQRLPVDMRRRESHYFARRAHTSAPGADASPKSDGAGGTAVGGAAARASAAPAAPLRASAALPHPPATPLCSPVVAGREAAGGPPQKQHLGDSEEVTGRLKSFNTVTGYGFISSAQVSGDIFLQGSQLPDDAGLEQGRPLRCTVWHDAKGRPQARRVAWLAPAAGADAGAQGRHVGRLKSMGASYGFIECADTFRQYGADVYLTRCQLTRLTPDWQPQQMISFQVVMDAQGRPQASNVHGIGPARSNACAGDNEPRASASTCEPDAVTDPGTTCSESADGSSSDELWPKKQFQNASRW